MANSTITLASAQVIDIEDDGAAGAAIGSRSTLNFTGAGVIVTDDSGNDEIDIAIAGGGSLSDITAASAGSTIANGDNEQVWNWATTTSGSIGMRFGETTASVAAGTAVLLQIDTLAASTAIPLLVKSRGTEVFRVDSVNPQILTADGTASLPPYSFLTDPNTGVSLASADRLIVSAGGSQIADFKLSAGNTQLGVTDGTAAAPSLTFINSNSSGLLRVAANAVGISADGVIKANFRVASSNPQILYGDQAAADKYGQISTAFDNISTAGDAQKCEYQLNGITTDVTETEIFLDGSSARLTIASGTSFAYSGLLVVRETSTGDTKGIKFDGIIKNVSGTTTLVGSTNTTMGQDVGAWVLAITADDTNDALVFKVTGQNSKTLHWHTQLQTSEVI